MFLMALKEKEMCFKKTWCCLPAVAPFPSVLQELEIVFENVRRACLLYTTAVTSVG